MLTVSSLTGWLRTVRTSELTKVETDSLFVGRSIESKNAVDRSMESSSPIRPKAFGSVALQSTEEGAFGSSVSALF